MKILIVSQYFWPENFRINEIVELLRSKGHDVDVLTCYPNYPEGKIFENYKRTPKKYNKYFGANIYRVPVILRKKSTKFDLFLNYLTFTLSSILIGSFKLRKKKYDLIFTFATSPITVAITSIFLCKIKNAKHILWVLDLWPDILKELKIVKNKIILKILDIIVYFIYKNTHLILAQSHSFIDLIKKKTISNNIVYLPAWSENIDLETENDENKFFIKDKKKLTICFTGNIGEAQNFENIMIAANILKKNEDIEWVIVGTGRNIEKIKKFKEENHINNFYFLGSKSLDKIKYYHDLADILLVSLKSGKAISSTIPGKIQTYLASNKFILGFIEGEAQRIINESKTGLVVNPNNPEELAEKIIFLKKNRSIVREPYLAQNGSKYLSKEFNKKNIFEKLNNYIFKVYQDIEKIKLIKNPRTIPWNKNFTLSGLNLAFLGYYSKGLIKLHPDLYNWSDGIFYNRFFRKQTKKIAGRDLILQIELPKNIKKIYVFGTLSNTSLNYLKKKFKKEVVHIYLPHDSAQNLFNNFCNISFKDSDFIILTLPTPKQEQFAQLIRNNNNNYKVICVGGAVVMASGEEKPMPHFFEKMGLEFIWRLRTDTLRRIKRLIVTSTYYILGEISFKYKRIKKEFLDNE